MLLKMMLIMLIGIMFIGIIPADSFDENAGTAFIQSMCSFDKNMTVNCDEKWIMIIMNSTMVQLPDETWAGAYLVPGYVGDGEKYSVCNFLPQIRNFGDEHCSWKWFVIGSDKTDSCWNKVCYPLIWHEIMHLLCTCNWHLGLTNQWGYTDLPENNV